jgi:2-oxoisovalerate dehydrogenase E1 component beta subunit
LYRAAVEDVPDGDYEIELGKGEIMREGSDVTVVGWGGQLRVLEKACDLAEQNGISCELIDLKTLAPWDVDIVTDSVMKTGKVSA